MVVENEIKEMRKQVNKLSQRVRELTKLVQLSSVGVLTVRQAALLGLYEEDTLYALISEKKILAYRPTPKRILIDAQYFINNFLKTNPNFNDKW